MSSLKILIGHWKAFLLLFSFLFSYGCSGGNDGSDGSGLQPTPTISPSPTPTPTISPTPTPTPTISPSPTPTPTISPSPTPTPIGTPIPDPVNFSDVLDMSAVQVDDPGSTLPAGWNRKANFMEIYVRAYQDSDGDGSGDLQGLINRLDYLKDLGITGIWLMPVTESFDNDHGYAVIDYRDIEDDYGSLEDFEELLSEAHTRGIGIIIDYVINHSSSENPLFKDFAASFENEFRNWYKFSPTDLGWGPWGDAWHAMPDGAEGFYYGAFFFGMPDFNLENNEVVDFHLNNLRFWLNMGVDGFRFDAVGVLFENGNQTVNQPENFTLMKRIQDAVNEYENRYIVCEAPDGPDAFASADACGSAFAFGQQHQLINTARNSALAADFIVHLNESDRDRMPLFLSNHDHFAGDRVAQQLGNNLAKMKIAAAINILLSPQPFAYYGEEIGMNNAVDLNGDWSLRTPMSWTDDPVNAGFTSAAEPFRSLSENSISHNVAAQDGVAGSLLEHYRAMYRIKNELAVLSLGTLDVQSVANDSSLVFTRRDGTDAAAVLLNLSEEEQVLTVLTGAADAAYNAVYPASLSDGTSGDTESQGEVTLTVGAQSLAVLSYPDGDINVLICEEPYLENEAGDACVLPISDSQPDPVVTVADNQLLIFYKRDDTDYGDWQLHIWNSSSCNVYTNSQLEGVTWADGVDPSGVDPNYGLYWLLDIMPGSQIGDCANFIVHRGDNKAISEADQIALIDEDAAVFAVERYGRVFPLLWILD